MSSRSRRGRYVDPLTATAMRTFEEKTTRQSEKALQCHDVVPSRCCCCHFIEGSLQPYEVACVACVMPMDATELALLFVKHLTLHVATSRCRISLHDRMARM